MPGSSTHIRSPKQVHSRKLTKQRKYQESMARSTISNRKNSWTTFRSYAFCNTDISVLCRSYTSYRPVPHKYSHQGRPGHDLTHFSESRLTASGHKITSHAILLIPPSYAPVKEIAGKLGLGMLFNDLGPPLLAGGKTRIEV